MNSFLVVFSMRRMREDQNLFFCFVSKFIKGKINRATSFCTLSFVIISSNCYDITLRLIM